MEKKSYFKTSTPILSILETLEFTKSINFAIKNLNLEMLKEVFNNFNLQNHADTHDFLGMARYLFTKFNSIKENVEIINVQDRASKCIACSFGKTVKAYDVEYKKTESSIAIVYSSSFAINLDISSGELMEFAWCNAFLDKKEMEELSKI